MAEYYVVLGDVVRSRHIDNRQAFRENLSKTCKKFSAVERDDVQGDFRILKGVDEFGGVLLSLRNIYDIVRTFQDSLHPQRARIAVSVGRIDVGLASSNVEKMDGEAFHRASEQLSALEGDPFSFDLRIPDESLGRSITNEINLLLHLRNEWTDRQREVIDVIESADTQMAAADRLGVTQQAVANILARDDWLLIKKVEDRLRKTMQEYQDNRD